MSPPAAVDHEPLATGERWVALDRERWVAAVLVVGAVGFAATGVARLFSQVDQHGIDVLTLPLALLAADLLIAAALITGWYPIRPVAQGLAIFGALVHVLVLLKSGPWWIRGWSVVLALAHVTALVLFFAMSAREYDDEEADEESPEAAAEPETSPAVPGGGPVRPAEAEPVDGDRAAGDPGETGPDSEHAEEPKPAPEPPAGSAEYPPPRASPEETVTPSECPGPSDDTGSGEDTGTCEDASETAGRTEGAGTSETAAASGTTAPAEHAASEEVDRTGEQVPADASTADPGPPDDPETRDDPAPPQSNKENE